MKEQDLKKLGSRLWIITGGLFSTDSLITTYSQKYEALNGR
tara:strand:- start:104598 stop:104720 length:123 start_codon:yes stop_codon:yes gene_type:complete